MASCFFERLVVFTAGLIGCMYAPALWPVMGVCRSVLAREGAGLGLRPREGTAVVNSPGESFVGVREADVGRRGEE